MNLIPGPDSEIPNNNPNQKSPLFHGQIINQEESLQEYLNKNGV